MTLLYSPDHTWVRYADGSAQIGISAHAQSELGDILYIELPAVGTALTAGTAFGVVESVKTASDLIAPVDGTVTAVNTALHDEPWRINDAPLTDGWMLQVACAEPVPGTDLLDEAAYLAQV